MKTILLVGSNGEIGKTLAERLKDKYIFIGCDIKSDNIDAERFYTCDVSDYPNLEKIFRNNKIDVVINLAGLEEVDNIPSIEMYTKMVDCYLNGTFYLLTLMNQYSVNKMILASSNHVTDCYEKDGYSTLGREISAKDYPLSKSIYGDLKLAAESFCHSFYYNCGISSISFRIGTFRREYKQKKMPDRWKRTIVTTSDLIEYFERAIESDCKSEVYYLVSENKDKPWDTTDVRTNLFQNREGE